MGLKRTRRYGLHAKPFRGVGPPVRQPITPVVLFLLSCRRSRGLLAAELADQAVSAVCVASVEEALNHLAVTPPRVIVLDLLLQACKGEAFLSHVRRTGQAELLAGQRVHSVLRKGPGVAAATAQK